VMGGVILIGVLADQQLIAYRRPSGSIRAAKATRTDASPQGS
jgi:hypothetical protein